MRHLLSILPKPSHYIGIEEGSVHKKPESVSLRLALAFPDMYEVGMSYLGQKILYGLVNDVPHWQAERVFAPSAEAGEILKAHKAPLCSLETDTPLAEFDAVGFSLTHELCYTNVLYMLDLAGIPFRTTDRLASEKRWPVILAGGGCTLAAEPVAPFFDLMLLGDGEDVLPEMLRLLEKAKTEKWKNAKLIFEAASIPGVYAPSLYEAAEGRRPPVFTGRFPQESNVSGKGTAILPQPAVTRRAVNSLDKAYFPERQVVPFGAVHNRLTLEIARGCTRSCRFCQAGIIYRPARERSLPTLENLLDRCLASTGYDDVSYLSLSTGDFSALKAFFNATIERCAAEQVAVSLPSLRVGSIDDSIMERMAGLKRTGATLAPEAGSQRLRNVINKGVTEEQLILHTQKLFEHGWQQVKLYFMLGLPTETDDDVLAILDLCRKVRDAAGPGVKRLQVTAALSPFVPKPHTPFQWEAQISREEIHRRVGLLLNAVKGEKRVKLRWHEPEMSVLEGIFSRGDRRLAPVVERAYAKKAIFSSWIDHFTLDPWLEAMAEEGLNAEEYTGALDTEAPLPWDHLASGVSKDFLLKERERAFAEKVIDDCRYGACRQCGVCDTKTGPSSLYRSRPEERYENRLNLPKRDQEAHSVKLDQYGRVIPREPQGRAKNAQERNMPPDIAPGLADKVSHFRIWYAKKDAAVYLSQLELQAVFERAMRRAGLPLSFSQGYTPAPLLSFARALPVGVASNGEWFSLYLREARSAQEVAASFQNMPPGLFLVQVEKLPLGQRPPEAMRESYRLEWRGPENRKSLFVEAGQTLARDRRLDWTKKGKKHDKTFNLANIIRRFSPESETVCSLTFDWTGGYASPLALTRAAISLALGRAEDFFSLHELYLEKTAQE